MSAAPVLRTAWLPRCTVCDGHAWSPGYTGTPLRICTRCGTVLNDRSDTRQEEERRYESYSTAPGPDEAAVAIQQWRWLKTTLPSLSGSAFPSVLDIGCGHGAFLRAVQHEAGRAAGIELDAAAVASCRRSGLSVVHGSLFDVGVPQGPWDLVTMWDVLDHLEHPREALALVVQELAPGGIIVLRGRNTELHAPFKIAYSRVRPFAQRLQVSDVSCVHRWGLRPSGYRALLCQAGACNIQLYPGLPTPGDRTGALGPRILARALKLGLAAVVLALYRASRGALYPFPSVLISGQKPSEGASSSLIRTLKPEEVFPDR